jgi:hypothetical protein
MHRRRNPPGPLGVQALYTIPALARVAKVTRYLLRRLLLASGVQLLRSGRLIYVPLSEIERRIPPLWQSICAGERVVRPKTRRGSARRRRTLGRLGRGSPKGRSIDGSTGCRRGKRRPCNDSSDHPIRLTGSRIDFTGRPIVSTRHPTDSTRRGFGFPGSRIDTIDFRFDLTWRGVDSTRQRFDSTGRRFDSIDRGFHSAARRIGSTRFGVVSNDCPVVSSEVDGRSRRCLAGSMRKRSP